MAPHAPEIYDLDENGEHIRLPSERWKSHKESPVGLDDHKYGEIRRQSIDKISTVHLGPAVSYMKKQDKLIPEVEQSWHDLSPPPGWIYPIS